MVEIAELTGTTPAEVRGTASFYDLLHLEPVGTYVVGICTNIACLLAGGIELLEHAAQPARRARRRRRRPTARSRSRSASAWGTATSRRACR